MSRPLLYCRHLINESVVIGRSFPASSSPDWRDGSAWPTARSSPSFSRPQGVAVKFYGIVYMYTYLYIYIYVCVYTYIYIYMWQGPFGIMRTIACFKHPTPASVLVPFLSPCLPPCSLQLVPLLLFLHLSCCPSLCMYILDVQVSLFSICLRACLPLFSSGSVLSFLPNH